MYPTGRPCASLQSSGAKQFPKLLSSHHCRSSMRSTFNGLPYSMQAVERANTEFVMLELGARFATWIVRGAQAHQRRNGARGSSILVATEPSPHWVHLANEPCKTNEVNCTIHNGWHGPPDLQIQGVCVNSHCQLAHYVAHAPGYPS